ncbi:MAG: hypothetical protein FJ317_02535 [SAR202 cluster bacterium]|nr:hypothetical protein [SAR202 cluster bacterium]
MPEVKLKPYRHGRRQNEAIQLLEQHREALIAQFSDRFASFNGSWHGHEYQFSFTTKQGRSAKGAFIVEDQAIHFRLDVEPLGFIERKAIPPLAQHAINQQLDSIYK